MNNRKNFRNYINYFKKWEGMGALGIGMMAVGFLLLWLGFSFLSYILAIIGMVGGLGVFLYGSIGRAHEADLQSDIRHRAETIRFGELEEDPHFRRRVPKTLDEEQVFEGYVVRDGIYLKKLKTGKLCSSEYMYAKLLKLTDAYYIKILNFSFVSEEKELSIHEIPFDALEDVTVVRDRKTVTAINRKQFSAKTCFLCFVYDGGKQVLLPANDDIYTDDLAEKLKKNAK